MVNFRYHLVTLIAVFLALAIGVVLGAGPLQTRIDDRLSAEQTESSPDLAEQLDGVEADAQTQRAALEEIGRQVLPGTLDGVAVALVTLPGADPDDVQAIRDDLGLAGAVIAGSVSLTDNWQSPSMAQYRQTLAGPVASHLATAAPADATADAVIGFAVVEVLTSVGSEQDLLRDILTDETTPILTMETDPEGAAQAIVVVGPRASEASSQTGSESGDGDQAISGGTAQTLTAWTGLARAVSGAPEGAVMVGDASTRESMIAQIRAQSTAVTTVDSVGTAVGPLATALALPGAAGADEARSFGVGEGATDVLPAIPGRG